MTILDSPDHGIFAAALHLTSTFSLLSSVPCSLSKPSMPVGLPAGQNIGQLVTLLRTGIGVTEKPIVAIPNNATTKTVFRIRVWRGCFPLLIINSHFRRWMTSILQITKLSLDCQGRPANHFILFGDDRPWRQGDHVSHDQTLFNKQEDLVSIANDDGLTNELPDLFTQQKHPSSVCKTKDTGMVTDSDTMPAAGQLRPSFPV